MNMSFIDEKIIENSLIRIYKTKEIATDSDAIKWIINLKNIKEIKVDSFSFDKMANESENNSVSYHMRDDVSIEEMEKLYKDKDIDFIIMYGQFLSEDVMISISTADYTVTIVTNERSPFEFERLEKELNL
jgi:hypothetical protein